MKKVHERRLVVILFVLVMITFSVAQRESRKLDALYKGLSAVAPRLSAPLAFLPSHEQIAEKD